MVVSVIRMIAWGWGRLLGRPVGERNQPAEREREVWDVAERRWRKAA